MITYALQFACILHRQIFPSEEWALFLWNSKHFHKFQNYICSVLWIWTLFDVYYYSCMFVLLEKWREVKKQRENQHGWGPTTVSPTSPTLDLIGFGYPYLHTIFLLCLQFCRLSKNLGVLIEDGDYYWLEIQLSGLNEKPDTDSHPYQTILYTSHCFHIIFQTRCDE